VTAFAPASVSNVASGFDIMGFALEGLGDTVSVRLSATPGVRIVRVSGFADGISLDPEANTAGPPALDLCRRHGTACGIEIEIHKGFAPGSGLGSSAASAAASAVACNALLGAGLSKVELLECALRGEELASGARHADNVAPAVLGGFVLVRGYDPLDVIELVTPAALWCSIVRPHITISTRASRLRLPANVPLADVVRQTGNAAGLVAGLLTGDFELIGRSLHDVIAEPYRAETIDGFPEIKRAASEAGALGCSISGSGPAVFALAGDRPSADDVVNAMGRVLERLGKPHDRYVSRINTTGAIILPPGSHEAR
jgi:homoserine kinase